MKNWLIFGLMAISLMGCTENRPMFPYVYEPNYACNKLVMGAPSAC